ncbi:DUF3558 domain-containing protein [Streptomyces sp. NBC_01565]|uniref:DUF3558 domain-containing protein n=1 Tax=Streptomyces sp. NBC_01565 TaxID=2975881 RepID=UPI002258B704|nr:DUF3558 domain-containing protein [Streptomyces sp. NBC_01565]MCX4542039.1 DUF3558 domain-containing protein [Streptomyces sp. NBC_01565]
MQRKAAKAANAVRRVLPGIAMLTALATVGLTGCTSGSGGGAVNDAKAGGNPAPAPAGKYRSLPSPCKAPESKRLKAMLPAPDPLTEETLDKLYAGTADTSYDGDRHVGCRWTATTPAETRLLYVGFERVVSYDRATASDDDRARQVYVRRLTDAKLPFPGPTTSPSTGTSPTPGTTASPSASPSASASTGAGASPSASASTGPRSPGASPGSATPTPTPELGSRVLEDLGDEAFIEDKLSAAGATAAQARSVRIVFRTSNVLVTVEYSVQPSPAGAVPPSTETQDRARQLAQALAERFSE